MCIRDSSYIAPQIPVFDHSKCVGCMTCVTECPDTAILGKVALPGVLELAPVSYTHLRAHETVLDIVCRLLLEKNKLSPTVDMKKRSLHMDTY